MNSKLKVRIIDIWMFIILSSFFIMQIIPTTALIPFMAMFLVASFAYCVYDRDNIIVYIFLIILLQKAVQRIAEGVFYQFITYFDEIIIGICLILLLIDFLNKKVILNRSQKKIIVFYLFFFGISAISTISKSYNTFLNIILDVFMSLKFIIYLWFGYYVARNEKRKLHFLVEMNFACRYMAVILLLFSVHDLMFTPFFEKYDYRYFTESLQLCFLHPTYLAVVCVTLIIILMCNMKNYKDNLIYMIMLAIVTCLTFRTKALIALISIVLMYFAYVKYEIPNKKIIMLGIGGIVACALFDRVKVYADMINFGTVPVRIKMMQDGISIAKEHFPFGAGFATFGTTVSYESKSIFYQKYDYLSGYYLTQPVADTFWPAIFAQGGWIGTIFFSLCLIMMFIESINYFKIDKYVGWTMCSIMVYALISSTAETGFYNPAIALMFFVYGYASMVTDRSKTNMV